MTGDDERRGFTRVPLKVKMFVSEGEGEGEGLLYFYTSNISAGGVFIISDLLLDDETALRMEFVLPFNDQAIPIKVDGVVRWQQNNTDTELGFTPPGMGIAFTNLDPRHREAVQRYIDSHVGD